jgi:hypothetical protein
VLVYFIRHTEISSWLGFSVKILVRSKQSEGVRHHETFHNDSSKEENVAENE